MGGVGGEMTNTDDLFVVSDVVWLFFFFWRKKNRLSTTFGQVRDRRPTIFFLRFFFGNRIPKSDPLLHPTGKIRLVCRAIPLKIVQLKNNNNQISGSYSPQPLLDFVFCVRKRCRSCTEFSFPNGFVLDWVYFEKGCVRPHWNLTGEIIEGPTEVKVHTHTHSHTRTHAHTHTHTHTHTKRKKHKKRKKTFYLHVGKERDAILCPCSKRHFSFFLLLLFLLLLLRLLLRLLLFFAQLDSWSRSGRRPQSERERERERDLSSMQVKEEHTFPGALLTRMPPPRVREREKKKERWRERKKKKVGPRFPPPFFPLYIYIYVCVCV